MHFFRKMFVGDTAEQQYLIYAEKEIVKILMKNPHINIVTYYHITDFYIDMELLDTDSKLNCYEELISVKDFLQTLGIFYIDWKIDNIGKSIDNQFKLFDFNASGIIDISTQEWIVKPVETFWNYKKALENGCKTPKEIDDWSFKYAFGLKIK